MMSINKRIFYSISSVLICGLVAGTQVFAFDISEPGFRINGHKYVDALTYYKWHAQVFPNETDPDIASLEAVYERHATVMAIYNGVNGSLPVKTLSDLNVLHFTKTPVDQFQFMLTDISVAVDGQSIPVIANYSRDYLGNDRSNFGSSTPAFDPESAVYNPHGDHYYVDEVSGNNLPRTMIQRANEICRLAGGIDKIAIASNGLGNAILEEQSSGQILASVRADLKSPRIEVRKVFHQSPGVRISDGQLVITPSRSFKSIVCHSSEPFEKKITSITGGCEFGNFRASVRVGEYVQRGDVVGIHECGLTQERYAEATGIVTGIKNGFFRLWDTVVTIESWR